jgi:hypothetical protein
VSGEGGSPPLNPRWNDKTRALAACLEALLALHREQREHAESGAGGPAADEPGVEPRGR